MPVYRVQCQPTDQHVNRDEFHNRTPFEGVAADQKEAVTKWQSLNGLDGIGVERWPLVVTEVKPEVKAVEPEVKKK